MNKRLLTTLAASALVAGGAAAGIASAADRAAADAKAATASAGRAGKALARHDAAVAVAAAEQAVGLAPRDAGYRVLLGQSYLAAGRFVSARGAFADALSLSPTNGKAALNLVLAQIATGDWATARATLDEHGAGITAADRGLALALAGDPAGAVALLTQVARSPETSPKVRQNLALSLALAGEWPAAKAVAAADLSPAALDARMEQWAGFARPHAASDQVATLLGVTAVEDHGQPAALALNGGAPVAVAVAAPVSPVPASVPADARPAPASIPLPPASPGFVAADQVVFGPRVEVVQPVHLVSPAKAPVAVPVAGRLYGRPGPVKLAATAPLIAAPAAPVRIALKPATPVAPARVAAKPAAPAASARASFFVQLGAYGSAAVAHDAWNRAARRMPTIAANGPSGTSITVRHTSFYRLSVGGFARPQADALCRRFRATGGDCFVRASAGDQLAAWAKKGVQVASR